MSGGSGDSWRARIIGAPGVAGAGTVVSREAVLTCAHVVAFALGSDPRASTPPRGPVTVDFPGSSSRIAVEASVLAEAWRPVDDCDLALLEMGNGVPSDVMPAALRVCDDPVGRQVRVFGHPPGLDGGEWSRAELVGAGGPLPTWLQFDGRDSFGRPVSRGFSGAGVVDDLGSVIGVVVAADKALGLRVAWMIPTTVVAESILPLC